MMGRRLIAWFAVCWVALPGCAKPLATDLPDRVAENPAALPAASEKLVFKTSFDTPDWRDQWVGSETAWTVKDGRLQGEGDRNGGLWWKGSLPSNYRIRFDGWARSSDGDLKVEFGGETREHQSGYVAILGGWKNRISILARRDEHGKDRKENRKLVTTPGKKHVFELTGFRGKVRFLVDGSLVAEWQDDSPLQGEAFGFANWEAPVAYDDLKIYALEEKNPPVNP